MTIEIFVIWILLWFIFLIMGIVEERGPVFQFMAGLWILFIGIYLYLSGLQYQSGYTTTTVGTSTAIVNVYSEVIPPVQTYRILWAIPFMALSLYLMFLSINRKKKNVKG